MCHILRLKCTRIDFAWGSTLDHTKGAYSAPPDPLAAGIEGTTSNGRGGVQGRGKVEGRGRDGKGRRGED